MALPDVVGLELEDALTALQDRKIPRIEFRITSPANAFTPEGRPRVVRTFWVSQEKIELLVAFEHYLKGGVEGGIQDY